MNQKKTVSGLSVIIPTYNPLPELVGFISRIEEVLLETGSKFEILLVDDCSPSKDSESVFEEVKGSSEYVEIVRLNRNVGQQRALLKGVSGARYDLIATLDDDLQHRPEDLPRMMKLLEDESIDVVVGAFVEKKHGLIRDLCTAMVRMFSWRFVGVPHGIRLTSFRMLRSKVGAKMLQLHYSTPVFGFMMCAVTSRMVNLEVEHRKSVRKSSYSYRKLVTYFFDMLIEYSDLPLRCVAYLGGITFVGALFASVYYATIHFMGITSVDGFTTMVVLIAILGGGGILALSVLGLYIRRIFLVVVKGSGSNVVIR